jgi:predicted ATP-dependent endonuclease of OLD family
MVSGPSPIGSIPILNYTPDPGEPAARLSAPQTQTSSLVTSQELRNETRLRRQAVNNGEDIIYSNKSFDLTLGKMSPVYNAGLTTVVTRPDGNGFLPDIQAVISPVQQEEDKQPQALQDTENADNPEEDNPLGTPGMDALQKELLPSEEELDEEKQELANEDERLQRNLTQAAVEKDQALKTGDLFQFQSARREESLLERAQQQIDKQERQVEITKQEARLRDFQETSTHILSQNMEAAAGLLDVMFGLGTK